MLVQAKTSRLGAVSSGGEPAAAERKAGSRGRARGRGRAVKGTGELRSCGGRGVHHKCPSEVMDDQTRWAACKIGICACKTGHRRVKNGLVWCMAIAKIG